MDHFNRKEHRLASDRQTPGDVYNAALARVANSVVNQS